MSTLIFKKIKKIKIISTVAVKVALGYTFHGTNYF